eukprot:Blabericola_migrator_1__971@NODE_1242_length_5009_cov_162_340146_g397_i2_p2_GENE_NODE_1242_length_5009_cov_162_340146_g397_i2NODE_1242_length_5009_cov_162_340146_g397_i2_p2_ORF_typecomplete_len475_score42_00KAR9/PF08580_10/0_76_NODE_1242_length_5009_cov_162_340146_g397_i234154839
MIRSFKKQATPTILKRPTTAYDETAPSTPPSGRSTAVTPKIIPRSPLPNRKTLDVSLNGHKQIPGSPTGSLRQPARPPLSRGDSRAHTSPAGSPTSSRETSYELGAPVKVTFWAELFFSKSSATRTDRTERYSVSGRNKRPGLQRISSAASTKLSKRQSRSQPLLLQPGGNWDDAVTGELRILRQGFKIQLADNDLSSKGYVWLGFILKRWPSAGLSASTIDVGIDDLRHVAFTGSKWAYGVASKEGQIHVCSINLGDGFGIFMKTLSDNMRRVKQDAKIEGYWPSCRVELDFHDESLVNWLCTHAAESDHERLARKWSLKQMAPSAGLIRQDLTWSISPLRSIFSEATGLKGSFVPTAKFIKGYKRWLQSGKSAYMTPDGMVPSYVTLEIAAAHNVWNVRLTSKGDATPAHSEPDAGAVAGAGSIRVKESEAIMISRTDSITSSSAARTPIEEVEGVKSKPKMVPVTTLFSAS